MKTLPYGQSAYRQLYSTETALRTMVNDLLVLLDEGKCRVLMLVLSAASELVVHNILLEDMKFIGVDGKALAYLQSFLSDGTFCAQVGISFSRQKSRIRELP